MGVGIRPVAQVMCFWEWPVLVVEFLVLAGGHQPHCRVGLKDNRNMFGMHLFFLLRIDPRVPSVPVVGV